MVLTDYDTRMEDISSRKNRIKNVVVGLAIDENVYACMRKDAANLGLVEYGGLAGTFDKDRSSNTTLKPGDFVNPHSNRDVIRKNCFDV